MKYILVVEDEMLIRFSLSEAFKDAQTEIIAVPDAASALRALRDWSFSFCFLDIQLPDRSGLEIMSIIRQIAPKTRIIIMTGSEVTENEMAGIRARAYLFLRKPFDLFRVKRLVDAVQAGDENVYHELDELEGRLTERRKAMRQAAAMNVRYAMLGPGREEEEASSADLLDISDAGTRIRTASHLQPGSRLRFRNSVNNASGIVRWSTADKQKDRYVAGIQFVGEAGRHEDEQ